MLFLTVNLIGCQRMVQHLPVLLREVIEMFSLYEGCHYLDATFGGGGHTRALLERDPSSKVTVLDCDPEAYSRAVEMSKEYENHLKSRQINSRTNSGKFSNSYSTKEAAPAPKPPVSVP